MSCDDGTYKCQQNEGCIDKHSVCDRFPDCDEASEEQSCGGLFSRKKVALDK